MVWRWSRYSICRLPLFLIWTNKPRTLISFLKNTSGETYFRLIDRRWKVIYKELWRWSEEHSIVKLHDRFSVWPGQSSHKPPKAQNYNQVFRESSTWNLTFINALSVCPTSPGWISPSTTSLKWELTEPSPVSLDYSKYSLIQAWSIFKWLSKFQNPNVIFTNFLKDFWNMTPPPPWWRSLRYSMSGLVWRCQY